MIHPIIISKNQNQSREFVKALGKYKPVFVFDRCKPDIENGRIVVYEGEESEGFLAGKMRDIGYEFLTRNFDVKPNDFVLFLDGDRVPMFDLDGIDYTGFDSVLFTCLDDPRVGDLERVVEIPKIGENSSFWSCGVMIKNKYLEMAKKQFNGRIFDKRCDGVWGWEDIILGDYLQEIGCRIGLAPPWACLSGDMEIKDLQTINCANWYLRESIRNKEENLSKAFYNEFLKLRGLHGV